MFSKKPSKYLAGLFIVIWSTGFIVAKYGMPYAEPMTFLFLRFAGVLLCLTPVIVLMKPQWPSPKSALHLAVAGTLLQAGYLGGVWIAIHMGLSAALAALIVGLQPILTAMMASWLSERVNLYQWLGFCLGILGVGLVVFERIYLAVASPWAIYSALFALAAITAGTIYQKKYCPNFDLRTGSFIQFGVSALICFIAMFAFETREIHWNIEVIASLLWAILALSIGAISLLFLLIRHGEATRVSGLMYLTPPTTAVMSWLLFDEKITLLMCLGIVITMFGVLMVNKVKVI